MSANLERMMVQWQPPTMLESLFNPLDVGQKFAAHHDAISDKTILRMEIKNIRKSGMLDIALRDWALQTTQSSWAEFTFFVYKAKNTGATRQKQPGPPDSPPTSMASPRMTPPSPLPWPPHPHWTSLNWRALSLPPPMPKQPKSQLLWRQ